MTDARAVTDDELVLTHDVAAAPEDVFPFLVDADKMLQWMGTALEIEPRPGGKFWMNATGTDIASGSFVEVEPPTRVAFTWGWEGSADVPPGSTVVTITLIPNGDHTTIELRHGGLPKGAGDDHADGWGYLLPRLAVVAVGDDPGPNEHANH